jgi:hypothetical protein
MPSKFNTNSNSNEHFNLDGSRITNLDILSKLVQTLTLHAALCDACKEHAMNSGSGIVLQGEVYKDGLASLLQAKCLGCNEIFRIWTSNKVSKQFEINLGACWGAMATGSGTSSLCESLSTMGVPSMSGKTFTKLEEEIGKFWQEELQSCMREAGREEREIAVREGRFHEGVPAIDVIVDGGWSKRSHKHSYNALGGVAIIIGAKTSMCFLNQKLIDNIY